MVFQKTSNHVIVFYFILLLYLAFPLDVLCASAEFKPGSEPDGFRGIKWGTDIATLDDMQKIKTIFDKYSGLKITKYKKKNDILKLSGSSLEVSLDEILYIFFDNRFFGVDLMITGLDTAVVLKHICFERFGPGKKDDRLQKVNVDLYTWEGSKTELICGINRRENNGFIEMTSNKISDERLEIGAKRELKKFIPNSKERHGF
jgi:hypothetical protein